MRSDQPEAGPATVIEIPKGPGSGVVTGFAAHSIPQFVFVLILVACVAIPQGIFVTICFVATLAWCRNMPAGKGESGQVVIKLGRLPCCVVVALITPCSKLTLVFIVFAMAT
jgi:hypothetical protein